MKFLRSLIANCRLPLLALVVGALLTVGNIAVVEYQAAQNAPARSLAEAFIKDAINKSAAIENSRLQIIAPAAAGGWTDFGENKLIDFIFRAQASGLPTTWYVALYTTCPTDSTTGTEVTNANGYARVSVGANGLTVWAGTQSAGSTTASSGTNGTTSNNNPISFATVTTSSWGTINCWGLVDSGTYGAGNLWIYSAVTTPPTLTVGSTASFAAGQLTFQIDP